MKKFVAKCICVGLKIYRVLLSPDHGLPKKLGLIKNPVCLFYPTCSEYAEECFRIKPLGEAFKLTVKRISRCHSGTEPQVDLVP